MLAVFRRAQMHSDSHVSWAMCRIVVVYDQTVMAVGGGGGGGATSGKAVAAFHTFVSEEPLNSFQVTMGIFVSAFVRFY